MTTDTRGWIGRLTAWGLNTTGLVLLLSLPALWLSMSQRGFVLVIGIGVAAGIVYCLLAAFDEFRYGSPGAPAAAGRT